MYHLSRDLVDLRNHGGDLAQDWVSGRGLIKVDIGCCETLIHHIHEVGNDIMDLRILGHISKRTAKMSSWTLRITYVGIDIAESGVQPDETLGRMIG